MTNLLERAETKRETFYKLTNSADVPEAPSGNRNLLKNTKSFTGSNITGSSTLLTETYQDCAVRYLKNTNSNSKYQDIALFNNIVNPKTNSEYIANFWAKGSGTISTFFHGPANYLLVNSGYTSQGKQTVSPDGNIKFDLSNDWQRYWIVYKLKNTYPTSDTTVSKHLLFRHDNNSTTEEIWLAGAKLEEGNISTPYSQSPEDLGWSTVALVPTQSNRYLWKFEYIYYSDGSVEVSDPVNLSIAGNDGADGKTQYTHIAYADNATGGGFSQTDQTKAYIGMYVDFTATDSNDPTKYKWTKWKGSDGAQGIPGPKGADGKTPYIHFAYADDSKGTNFSLTDNNQQYQGYYSDYTQADSTDYTKYKWSDRLVNIKGGSRNYFKNSLTKTFQTTGAGTFDWRTYIVDAFWKNKDRLKKNFIKISFDITFPVALTNDYMANIHFSATPWYSNKVTFKAGTTSRQHFEFAIDLSSASENYYTDNVFIRFGTNYGFPSNFKVILENMMLSIGSYYPDYIQAIEDTQEQIDSKADQTLTQDQLNALAEKNNLIKAEMEAKASVETVNQWITAYQNYVKSNDADRAKSEQALQDASARILKLNTDVGDLKQQWSFIDTYLTMQNEGLIIGKSDGSAYAKFSDDRISLFSGGSEVMYISQGVLRIENGIFTKTIQIGRFRFETHPADKDMLVLRYLGGV